MKTIIFYLFIPFLTIAQNIDPNGSIRHSIVGGGISIITSNVIYYKTDRPILSCLIGIGTGVIAGISKEYIWDRGLGLGEFDTGDIVTTTRGSIVGGVLVCFVIDWKNIKNRRNKKKDINESNEVKFSLNGK